MKTISAKNMPLRAIKCATCPFRADSPYANLAPELALSAMRDASRICHSTGSNNAINRRTGKPPHLCRGARDVQLGVMAGLGVIDAQTDEAWNARRVAVGMKPTEVRAP
jgi:hypothetical protein